MQEIPIDENNANPMDDKLRLNQRNSTNTLNKIKPIPESSLLGYTSPSEKSKNCETSGQTDRKIFSAPPGVKRYSVKWSNVRRNPGGQRFIFVWPQKTRPRINRLIYFVPLLRRMLIGLMYLGSVHLWPGEYLPTTIPSTVPLPKPPVKCRVIEPLWEDEDATVARRTR